MMFCGPCSRGHCTHPGYCPEIGCWCWAHDDPRWRIRMFAKLRKQWRRRPRPVRTDPWRWFCRLCGETGTVDDGPGARAQRDRDAARHLEQTACGQHVHQGRAEAGRLLHVWTYGMMSRLGELGGRT